MFSNHSQMRIITVISLVILLNVWSAFKQCDNIPPLNKKILAFVKSNIKKKVGSGECWDLAAEALNKVNAKWDGNTKFGKEINYKKECVYPGDIIQFEGVILKYELDKKIYTEKLEHHTAVIFDVKEKGNFVIADQNTRFSGKTVGTNNFDVKTLIKGSFKIYRPIN